MKILIALFAVLLFLVFVQPSHAVSVREVPFQGSVCPYLTPQQIQGAYGFTDLYSQGLTGSGEAIAIIDAYNTPNILQNVNTFDSYYGLPQLVNGSNFFVYTPLGPLDPANSNWTEETTLDVEMAHSLAPGAKIYLVLAPNDGDLLQAVNYTINNLPVQIISISWGSPELDYSAFSINYYNSIFQSAYSKGINVFVATGDMGAYNGFSTPNVNFPASSPYVISVGGTVLSVSGDSYAGETAWSDSGGGFSEYFSRPSFQPDLGSYREVPDVAFNAGTTVCAFVNGSWRGFIGTSLAAPSWAALDAILDQKLGGTSQLLPTLYNIYNNYGNLAFHQITSGCNGYYCANGGYSLVTGLGSPIANALVQILSKSSDTLTFSSNVPVKFNLNGVNYTTPISINLSYGQKVTLTAYNFSFANTKYSFSSFSGQITSNNNTLTFFVNSSMNIVIDYVTEYAVREKLMNSTKIFWVENGSTIDLNLPLQYNSSGILGTLLGFSMDDGPLIHQDHFSSVVYAPINISAVFAIYNSTKIVFTGAPFGASAMVRYGIYTPLSASISETERTVYNGDTIYYAGSVISIFPLPTYVNNTRYVAYNFTGYPGMEKVIRFYAEKPSGLTFISLDGKKVLPSSIVFQDPLDLYVNGTIWSVPSSTPIIEKMTYDGFSLLNHSLPVTSGQIKLNVSTLSLNVNIFSIPLSNAAVILRIGNRSVQNQTNFLGQVSFQNVPDTSYNLSIDVYGRNYEYPHMSGYENSIDVYPLIYQVYLMVGAIGTVILVFVFFESIRRRYIKGKV